MFGLETELPYGKVFILQMDLLSVLEVLLRRMLKPMPYMQVILPEK